jgi:hypothetical protein
MMSLIKGYEPVHIIGMQEGQLGFNTIRKNLEEQ